MSFSFSLVKGSTAVGSNSSPSGKSAPVRSVPSPWLSSLRCGLGFDLDPPGSVTAPGAGRQPLTLLDHKVAGDSVHGPLAGSLRAVGTQPPGLRPASGGCVSPPRAPLPHRLVRVARLSVWRPSGLSFPPHSPGQLASWVLPASPALPVRRPSQLLDPPDSSVSQPRGTGPVSGQMGPLF